MHTTEGSEVLRLLDGALDPAAARTPGLRLAFGLTLRTPIVPVQRESPALNTRPGLPFTRWIEVLGWVDWWLLLARCPRYGVLSATLSGNGTLRAALPVPERCALYLWGGNVS
jgi:hypothetical protein